MSKQAELRIFGDQTKPVFRMEVTYEGAPAGGEQVVQRSNPTDDAFELVKQVLHAIDCATEVPKGEPFYVEFTDIKIVRVLPSKLGDYVSELPINEHSPVGFRFPESD